MLLEHDHPRAHLVMDDFFAPDELAAILRELPTFERRMKPGLVRDIGHDGQSVFFEHRRRKNRAVWIHDPAKTLRLFRERFWSDELVQAFANAREPLFQIIPSCSAPHLQVSSYMTGDHYDFHEDEGAGVNLTAIVFLAREPGRVHGGDLHLAYDGGETKIRFRHNRLVVFPSRTLHRVTRVRIDSEDPRHARISLQCWLTFGPNPEARPKKKRAPEADRPTFLLAEASILAAAQAMSTAATGDQSPEDVYWGAFYLSRILAQNLRVLAPVELALGAVRIRRGAALEVYARGRRDGEPVRIGFSLAGPDVPADEALQLFVEKGKHIESRALPASCEENDARAVLARLLVSRPSKVSPARRSRRVERRGA